MSKMKALVVGVALAIGGGAITAPAFASGVPTVDVAAIAQMIQQFQMLEKQLTNMQDQLKQAEQQVNAVTGKRGMEKMLRNEAEGLIPTNWQETLAQMNGGKIGNLAQSIKQNASRVDSGLLNRLLPAESASASDSFANSAANAQATAGQAYELSGQRFTRLQKLMDEIGNTTDAKGIAELQARIGVEQAILQNETIKMQALAQTASAQQAIQQQQMREMTLDRASTSNSMPSVR
jgi:type IV secretion system protein VirB5